MKLFLAPLFLTSLCVVNAKLGRDLQVVEVVEEKPAGCDPNWQITKAEYEANMANVWTAPTCYNFVFQRSCFCEESFIGPFQVKVRNGKVVGKNLGQVPTMAQILATIERECISGCPDNGAVQCNISYGASGEATDVYIDKDTMIADEEISYTITGFELCN